MIYRSQTQPFCRCCGKPIAKHVRNVWLETQLQPHMKSHDFSRYVVGEARSKAECQRFTNWYVVSVQYSKEHDFETDTYKRGHVRSFGEWDGESYKDEFFCSGPCVDKMAYAAMKVMPTLGTKAYRDAVAKTKKTETV